MKFVSIGKSRFRTIYKAAKNGEASCPFDLRFCPRGEQTMGPKAECVHQFLTKLYEETAECLPDGINSNKRPRQGRDRFDPPEMDRDNVKHLPPGSIREYHAQCQALYPQHTISKKLFSSVSCLGFKQHFLILEFLRKIFSCFPLGAENWWQQFLGLQVWQRYFKGLLRIRFDSHHAKCGQCLKHRMILKRLGNNPAAQRCQRAELDRHLKRQHADRQIYYLSRARSRLDASSSAPVTITCILDSMDQAKHSWPRSKAIRPCRQSNLQTSTVQDWSKQQCFVTGTVWWWHYHHIMSVPIQAEVAKWLLQD